MKDIEIVIFNDKSWVRLTEYQKNEEQLTKRIYELQSDLSKAKSQIEKMKDCGSCKHINKRYQINDICDSCFVYDKWELAE